MENNIPQDPCEKAEFYLELALTAWHKGGLYDRRCRPIQQNLESAEYMFKSFFRKYLRYKEECETT